MVSLQPMPTVLSPGPSPLNSNEKTGCLTKNVLKVSSTNFIAKLLLNDSVRKMINEQI